MFQRVPTLDSYSINFIGLHPFFYGHTKFSLQNQLITVLFRNNSILSDFFQFGLQYLIGILNLMGSSQNLGKVYRNDCNTRCLQQLLTGTNRLESCGTSTDSTDTSMTKTINYTADSCKFIDIGSQQIRINRVSMKGGISKRNVNPEKPDVPINKNDAFQKVQKRRVQEKR